MNEQVDYIKSEITKHRDNLEATRLSLLEADKKRIESDTELLSEVNDLFAEIVDEGIVKWSDSPVIETTRTKKFFGEYETLERTISDYTPAKVYIYVPIPNGKAIETPVYISLKFNCIETGDSYDGFIYNYNEIIIATLNGERYIISGDTTDANQSRNPIVDSSRIPELIIESIKKPIQTRSYRGYSALSIIHYPYGYTEYQTK